ncbi:hypothetical protein IWQ61_004259 [Dispira simplex]|nr:hypothetical protein IWQ61_004259 [Dispira simplex]
MAYNNVPTASGQIFKFRFGDTTTSVEQGLDINIRMVPGSIHACDSTAVTQGMEKNTVGYQRAHRSTAPPAAGVPTSKAIQVLTHQRLTIGTSTSSQRICAEKKPSKDLDTPGCFAVIHLLFGGGCCSQVSRESYRHATSTKRTTTSATVPMEQRTATYHEEVEPNMDSSAIGNALLKNSQAALKPSSRRTAISYPAVVPGIQCHVNNTYLRSQATYPRINHNPSATKTTNATSTGNIYGSGMRDQAKEVHWQNRSTNPTTATINQHTMQRNTHTNHTMGNRQSVGLRNCRSTSSVRGMNRKGCPRPSLHIQVNITPVSGPTPIPVPQPRPRSGHTRVTPAPMMASPPFPVLTGVQKPGYKPGGYDKDHFRGTWNTQPNVSGHYHSFM